MLVLSYAFVPIYNYVCKVTGIDGTPKIATTVPDKIYNRKIRVTFDATTDKNLNWKFHPKQKDITVKVGEQTIIFYEAENLSDKPITGMATFNVQPDKMGYYFNKIACFCFEKQTLKPKQRIDMPVTFFIDPEIMKDKNLQDVTEVTLSYTFYPSEE
jgi:cytochrome c oxidase assembly protein subunit 11